VSTGPETKDTFQQHNDTRKRSSYSSSRELRLRHMAQSPLLNRAVSSFPGLTRTARYGQSITAELSAERLRHSGLANSRCVIRIRLLAFEPSVYVSSDRSLRGSGLGRTDRCASGRPTTPTLGIVPEATSWDLQREAGFKGEPSRCRLSRDKSPCERAFVRQPALMSFSMISIKAFALRPFRLCAEAVSSFAALRQR
jgi:hypothetical protein